MIVNIGELISKRRNDRRSRKKIDIIDNSPSSASIEEAKAKVQAIIERGKKKRRNPSE